MHIKPSRMPTAFRHQINLRSSSRTEIFGQTPLDLAQRREQTEIWNEILKKIVLSTVTGEQPDEGDELFYSSSEAKDTEPMFSSLS